jgi:hypothetical protein
MQYNEQKESLRMGAENQSRANGWWSAIRAAVYRNVSTLGRRIWENRTISAAEFSSAMRLFDGRKKCKKWPKAEPITCYFDEIRKIWGHLNLKVLLMENMHWNGPLTLLPLIYSYCLPRVYTKYVKKAGVVIYPQTFLCFHRDDSRFLGRYSPWSATR